VPELILPTRSIRRAEEFSTRAGIFRTDLPENFGDDQTGKCIAGMCQ